MHRRARCQFCHREYVSEAGLRSHLKQKKVCSEALRHRVAAIPPSIRPLQDDNSTQHTNEPNDTFDRWELHDEFDAPFDDVRIIHLLWVW